MKVIVTNFSEKGYNIIPALLTDYYRDKFPVETIKKEDLIYFRGTWTPETFFCYTFVEE